MCRQSETRAGNHRRHTRMRTCRWLTIVATLPLERSFFTPPHQHPFTFDMYIFSVTVYHALNDFWFGYHEVALTLDTVHVAEYPGIVLTPLMS